MALASRRERVAELEAEVYALVLAYRDPRTPLSAKVLIALLVAYAASPIDPIPDVVPVVGFLDELVVLPLGAALALRLVPDEVVAECRDRATGELDAGRGRWVVAALVLLGWGVVVVLVARVLLG